MNGLYSQISADGAIATLTQAELDLLAKAFRTLCQNNDHDLGRADVSNEELL